MIEQILPDLYRLEIPIPKNPLKALNCYIIKGTDRNLIIDTGLDREESLAAMHEGLQELTIDLTKTDFFITHLHADHSGMTYTLQTPASIVYASQNDAIAINNMSDKTVWYNMEAYACRNGFPPDEAHAAIERHPGYQYGTKGTVTFTIIGEGATMQVGNYQLTVLETPGHTKGHLCLYEADKKILFSGDHILRDITPNISLWSDTDNPLGNYLTSLDKVAAYEVDLVLPGHRRTFTDCHTRIAELKAHHQRRCDEILIILKDKPLTSYEVASRMTWDLRGTWPDFPPPQKWFAAGEATAHLRYLVTTGVIKRDVIDGQTVYMLKQGQ